MNYILSLNGVKYDGEEGLFRETDEFTMELGHESAEAVRRGEAWQIRDGSLSGPMDLSS